MWDWLVYGALIVGALAFVAAAAFLLVRVLQAWRSFKRLRRHVFRDLDRVLEKTERTLDNAASASDTSRLDAALASLRVSLAQLALLREAIDEATALIPRP
ncbi:MAG: hypothetical protein JOY72_03200 [Actinobacteria bacterium]|nr:hypothetical protein [Actinomycetota bacterium]